MTVADDADVTTWMMSHT